MGIAYNPRIVTDGLVLVLDAGNTKSLNIPTQADHGYADWYCLVSGTVTYSIINSTGGVIYERNGSTVTTMVTASVPQRGTFSVTAGRTYYGSVPINLVVEDGHERMVPLTMMGTQFWSNAVRNNPSTYYVYSPYQSATVNFYDNTAGGLTGTPTSTLSLSAGQSGTFTSNNLTNHWISSNTPIVASVTQTGADKTILSPMSTYVYQRFQNNFGTTNFTTPTNNNTYVTYDSTYKVMNMSIADGSGSDCAQGLGLEYLSDTYSWGNVVSDYTIVFPYNGTFTASYWSGTAWVVWDTHTVTTGSITNPPRVTRDGTSGPGVEAGTVSGVAANMASGATLWKWEGNQPFYLCINDSTDDEFSVLGWLAARNTSPRSSNIITDITGRSNNGTLTNGPTYSVSNGGSLVFDGTDDYINGSITVPAVGSSVTMESIIFLNNTSGTKNIFTIGRSGTTFSCGIVIVGADLRFRNSSNDWSFSSPQTLSSSLWYHLMITVTPTTSTGYINSVSQGTTNQVITTNSITDYHIGRRSSNAAEEFMNGNIALFRIYNRALSAAEVSQNYNALKSRYI
jgi:hypothetical protein